MLFHINKNKTIGEVQEKFNDCFPYLKIEFYKKGHNNSTISPQCRISELSDKCMTGVLEIKSWFTVKEVEQQFRKFFDLNVQVFRNENNTWIPTTKTDTYTLREQSEFSEHAKLSIFPKVKEQLDEYGYL